MPQKNLNNEDTKRNLLMYRGKNYPHFVEEAKLFGVSRKVNYRSLANLKWNDEILMATFHTYGKHEDSSERKKDGSLRWPNGKPVNLGEARIDCAFSLKDVYINQPNVSQFVSDKLMSDRRLAEHVIPSEGRIVYRACGWYVIGNAYVIKTTIEVLYQLIQEAMEQLQINNAQVMIGGPLSRIFPPGTGLYDAKFTRGITAIETTGLDFGKEYESEHDGLNKVIRVHKYTPMKSGKYVDACSNTELSETA